MNKKSIVIAFVALFTATISCKKKEVSPMDAKEMPVFHEPTAIPNSASIAVDQRAKMNVPKDGKYPEMTFEAKEHDFGLINRGEIVTYYYKFENTGEANLIISRAVGSCGCTVPEYPKTPLKPGESAKIKVTFNSGGKHGKQQKSVTILTNTKEATEILLIKAEIKK